MADANDERICLQSTLVAPCVAAANVCTLQFAQSSNIFFLPSLNATQENYGASAEQQNKRLSLFMTADHKHPKGKRGVLMVFLLPVQRLFYELFLDGGQEFI